LYHIRLVQLIGFRHVSDLDGLPSKINSINDSDILVQFRFIRLKFILNSLIARSFWSENAF
jgi:hypothetical protein